MKSKISTTHFALPQMIMTIAIALILAISSPLPMKSQSAESEVFSSGSTIVKSFPRGIFGSNCFVVHNASEGIIIDAGVDPSSVAEYVFTNNLSIKAIILTHTHIDHAAHAKEIKSILGSNIFVHASDTNHYQYYSNERIDELLANSELNSNDTSFIRQFINAKYDIILSEDTSIAFGRATATIRHTPGHSAGSLSVVVDNTMVFVGDSFVYGNFGSSDFWTGNPKQYKEMLRSFILPMNDHTKVFQGHGSSTTISELRKLILSEP